MLKKVKSPESWQVVSEIWRLNSEDRLRNLTERLTTRSISDFNQFAKHPGYHRTSELESLGAHSTETQSQAEPYGKVDRPSAFLLLLMPAARDLGKNIGLLHEAEHQGSRVQGARSTGDAESDGTLRKG